MSGPLWDGLPSTPLVMDIIADAVKREEDQSEAGWWLPPMYECPRCHTGITDLDRHMPNCRPRGATNDRLSM